MRRDGTNLQAVRMEDVLCDFCHSPWTLDRLMIEGHHGSCICGVCIRTAYSATHLAESSDVPAGESFKCTMCLEERTDNCFRSPAYPDAMICLRCATLGATALARDADSNWALPTNPAAVEPTP